MDTIKVLILSTNLEEKFEIENILTNVDYISIARDADTMEDALAIIEVENVDVVLVSSNYNGDGYDFCERVTTEYMDKAVIIIESEAHEDIMHRALFSGAKDVVLVPIKPNKLVDSIYQANKLTRKRMGFQKAAPVKQRKSTGYGQIFTLFSTKGGVGKTFLSTNLAVSLAKSTGKKVALVDFDLDFGSVALALNLSPRYTISDVVDDIRNLDPEYLNTYMTNHESGVKVLAANIEPRMNEFINAEHIQLILKNLQLAYDYVIVDMPSRFYDPVNPAFVFAEKVFLLTTPEVATVRNIKGAITTFVDFNFPKSKISVLLNKQSRGSEIRPKDIEKTLGYEIQYVVPADYKKATSTLNQGIPYVSKHPRGSITKSINKMVKTIGEDKES